MKGNFAEIKISNSKYRFFEIYSIDYDERKKRRYIEQGILESTQLYQYLKLLPELTNINENVKYLYKLITYIGNPTVKDQWKFNESIEDYQEYGFTNIESLLNFCVINWNIHEDDFIRQEDTHIP